MPSRFIDTEQARESLLTFIRNQPLKFTVRITKGGARTSRQNRLFHQYLIDITRQMQTESHEWWRGYSKLHIGVPILRREDETFREEYDKTVRPLPYETKIRCMMEPIALPVTSRFTTVLMKEFLDEMHRHFSEQGIELTDPDALRYSGLEAR